MLAPKGIKQVGQATSAERGSQITLRAFINALDQALPPIYILPSRLERSRTHVIFDNQGKLIGGPDHSFSCFSDSDWIMLECFHLVLKHFKRFTNPTVDNPVFLLMDNHVSHCALENIKYTKVNNGNKWFILYKNV